MVDRMTAEPGSSLDFTNYYDAYWTDLGFNPKVQLSRAMRALLESHVLPGDSCLDIGCGDGSTYGPLMKARATRYVGADVSRTAVASARAKGLDVRLIEDAGALPFENHSFDKVLMIEVAEHLFSPGPALSEARRVLKPGGKILLTTPNVVYWRRRLDFAILGRWNPLGDQLAVEQPWRDPHIRFFNLGALNRLMKSAGFVNIEMGGLGGSILGDLPWLGARFRKRESSHLYRLFQEVAPQLFGYRLYSIGSVLAGS